MLTHRTPHPTREIFKRNGIIFGDVARSLGLSYTYTTAILSGLQVPSAEIDQRLRRLARQVEDVALAETAAVSESSPDREGGA